MRTRLPTLITSFILAISTTAQEIIPELSFGHNVRISPAVGSSIPGWQGSSANHNLQILSDRAILTPPVPGNARGALWTEKPITSETWIADIEFRASGQESGSGNLNIWFVKDKTPVFIDNLYTVSTFDGLLITLDQHRGSSGMIRGFLNDGTQDFKKKRSIDALAFGHCHYAYRNLGRPSKLKVTSQNGLTVSIDGKECFSSSKISLPSGYFFGITAATAEPPDSFEVQKFIVSSSIPHEHEHVVKGGAPPIQNQAQSPPQPQLQKLDRLPGAPELVPDKAATEIKGQEDQFADLHNRLQTLSHQVAMVFAELEEIGKRIPDASIHSPILAGADMTDLGTKLDSLSSRLTNVENSLESTRRREENIERVVELTRKGFESIERGMEATRKELEGRKYDEHFSRLNQALDTMTASAPRMGMFVFLVVGVQVLLAGAYVLYKRRRERMPKKYL